MTRRMANGAREHAMPHETMTIKLDKPSFLSYQPNLSCAAASMVRAHKMAKGLFSSASSITDWVPKTRLLTNISV